MAAAWVAVNAPSPVTMRVTLPGAKLSRSMALPPELRATSTWVRSAEFSDKNEEGPVLSCDNDKELTGLLRAVIPLGVAYTAFVSGTTKSASAVRFDASTLGAFDAKEANTAVVSTFRSAMASA